MQQVIQRFQSRLFSMCMFCNSFTASHTLLFKLLYQGHDNGTKKKTLHTQESTYIVTCVLPGDTAK